MDAPGVTTNDSLDQNAQNAPRRASHSRYCATANCFHTVCKMPSQPNRALIFVDRREGAPLHGLSLLMMSERRLAAKPDTVFARAGAD